MAFKRKRVSAPRRRTFKKRRITRRTRRNGNRSSGRSTTSRASNATSVGTFRTRKTSLSTYRNMLWRDTAMKTHYRSVFDTQLTPAMLTPNTSNSATLTIINGLPVFYTTAGGAVVANLGGAVPVFDGDIILRGGIARIALANRVEQTATQLTDNVRITVYAVWTGANPNTTVFPAIGTPVPTMWDPSLIPDFERFGKVMWKKEALLKADGESVQFYFKFKVQKIDQAVFNQVGGVRGQQLVWMVLASQLSNTEGAPASETIDCLTSHNVSFSGDST